MTTSFSNEESRQKAAELLNREVDQELISLPEQTFLKQHLSENPFAQCYQHNLKQTESAIRHTSKALPPEDLADRIMDRIILEKSVNKSSSTQKWILPPAWKATIAASFAALVLFGGYQLITQPSDLTSPDRSGMITHQQSNPTTPELTSETLMLANLDPYEENALDTQDDPIITLVGF